MQSFSRGMVVFLSKNLTAHGAHACERQLRFIVDVVAPHNAANGPEAEYLPNRSVTDKQLSRRDLIASAHRDLVNSPRTLGCRLSEGGRPRMRWQVGLHADRIGTWSRKSLAMCTRRPTCEGGSRGRGPGRALLRTASSR